MDSESNIITSLRDWNASTNITGKLTFEHGQLRGWKIKYIELIILTFKYKKE